jgi:hypothetical protein
MQYELHHLLQSLQSKYHPMECAKKSLHQKFIIIIANTFSSKQKKNYSLPLNCRTTASNLSYLELPLNVFLFSSSISLLQKSYKNVCQLRFDQTKDYFSYFLLSLLLLISLLLILLSFVLFASLSSSLALLLLSSRFLSLRTTLASGAATTVVDVESTLLSSTTMFA